MLLERVGDVRGQRIFAAHHVLLSKAVEDHGGDEVKWLGDGLMVAFPSAADAVRCALEMQRAARQLIEGERLPIRVGLHVGEALVEESDWFGMPVVIARRLCDRATGGQVLCTDVVRGVLAGHHEFSFAPAGELALKGLRDPVAAFALAPAADQPARALSRTPFVGRTEPLARLDAALARATGGHGSLVLVVGEPGIGKSRLLEEFGVAATTEAVVLAGQCYEGESGLAYSPFSEALDAYVAETDPDIARAELGASAAILAKLSPGVATLATTAGLASPTPIGPDEERLRLFDAMTQLLLTIGRRSTVVLVLDDLHWADHGTIALLRYVTRFISSTPMMVVGAYRDVELDRRHPLAEALAALRRQVEPERIKLDGLESTEVQQLLSMVAERDVPVELADALLVETEGNPFFLREVIINLIEEGKFVRADGRWTTTVSLRDLGIPEGVREVIGRRLSRLSDDANHLLSAASAFEGPFRFDCAASVAELGDTHALDALDEAIDAGLVRQAGIIDEYEFTHALIRHTLFTELNPSRQVRLHRQLAEALERLAPDAVARIAHHYGQSAALPGAAQGVEYAGRAAESAHAAHSFDEAAAYYALAIELLPTGDDRRARLLARQAISTAYGSEPGSAETLALDAASLLVELEGNDAALAFLYEATGAFLDVGLERAVWALANKGLPLLGDRQDMVWLVFNGIAATQRSVESGLGIATYTDAELEVMLRILPSIPIEERRGFFVPYPNRETALRFGAQNPSILLFQIGDYRRARDLGVEWLEQLTADGRISLAALAWSLVARCHIALGDFAAGAELIAKAAPLAARLVGPSPAYLNYLAARDEWRLAHDDGWEESMSDLQPLMDEPAPENQWAMAPVNAAGARMFARLGLADAAMSSLELALPAVERAPAYSGNYCRLACDLANALWWAERTDHLEVIERNLREKVVEPDFRYPMFDGRLSLARLCALTERWDEASEWFAAARVVLDEQGARPLRAIVDHDEAVMLQRRGEPNRVRELFGVALTQFRDIGMTGWITRAEAALA